jgi:hypothetical protein
MQTFIVSMAVVASMDLMAQIWAVLMGTQSAHMSRTVGCPTLQCSLRMCNRWLRQLQLMRGRIPPVLARILACSFGKRRRPS